MADFTLPPINKSFTAGIHADLNKSRDCSPKIAENRRQVNDFGNYSPQRPSPLQRRMHNLTVNDVVRSMKHVNTDFGIEGYEIPTNKSYLNIKRAAGFSKGKGEDDFISRAQKDKKWVPGAKYDVDLPWGEPTKNKFLKSRKVSITEEVLNKEGRWPGPANYSPKRAKSNIKGCFKSSQERPAFTEKGVWQGLQTPGAIYDVKTSLIHASTPTAKLFPTPKERFETKKRHESPPPGKYDLEESFKKTQVRRLGSVISKSVIPSLSDLKVKQKKFVPGVGSYNFEKAYDNLSPPPVMRRKK